MEKDTKLEGENHQFLRNKRKSERITKKEVNESDMQLINCHCCKIVDSAINMITCCKALCRESFCSNCIKKHNFKSNPITFLTLKEYEAINRWICYKCKKKCQCGRCEIPVKEQSSSTTQIQIPLRSTKRRFKNKILKKKNLGEKKLKEKPSVNKQAEDFSRMIQEEYDPDMMKNIDYIDDFCIYENDASIAESVLEKHYYEEKSMLDAMREQENEVNNFQPVREHWRKRKDKKNRKRKNKEKYQITQRNNNLIINIDLNTTPEKKGEPELEKKLCHICKKMNTNYKHIVCYDDFITFFINVSDQKENKNPDFIENRERIIEINNAFYSMAKTETTNIDLTICINCPKSMLNQKNGFTRILEMIQESIRVRRKQEKIRYDKINFINDKPDENNVTTIEEMKNCIRLLESFTKFQKMLVFRIFSQCDDYVTQTVNYLASFDVTVGNLINLNNFYNFMDNNDGSNFNVLKNILLYKSNLITLFCLNVGVLKNQFNHFVSKYENGEDPTKIRPETMINPNFLNLFKTEESEKNKL